MDIQYTVNPLACRIILNDYEKRILQLQIQLEDYRDELYNAYFHLATPKTHSLHNPDRGIADLILWEKLETEGLSSYEKEHYEECYKALTGIHIGDCTCFPSSCFKCHMEGLLDINTISGLSKHMGHTLYRAFLKHNTKSAVLEYLNRPYTLDPNDGYDGDKTWWTREMIDGWNVTRLKTIDWLINYWKQYNVVDE